MAPYCLLPNHVIAFYEYIWEPFIFVAAYAAVAGLLERMAAEGDWAPAGARSPACC